MGQRLMQPASDIFLGWAIANGRHFYVRQLHDAKIKPLVETFDAGMLDVYGQAGGWVLARAHARASEATATISAYLGSSNEAFDAAMGKLRWPTPIRLSAIMRRSRLRCEKARL
jgi:hypothetical protein